MVVNWTDARLAQPHDPILMISIRVLFWIVSGICLLLALVCLFREPGLMQPALVTWLAANYLVYRAGLFLKGGGSLAGFCAGFPANFGISPRTAGLMADFTFGYLILGGGFFLVWLWRKPLPIEANEFQKMSCPACGGHIKFPRQDVGRQIPCPHCQQNLKLRRDENLKMSCFFCQGHIEFPAHAIGQKLKCPHCHMDIGLKEPA